MSEATGMNTTSLLFDSDERKELERQLFKMVRKLERYRRAPPPEGMPPHVVRRRRQIATQKTIADFFRAVGCVVEADEAIEIATDLSEQDKGRGKGSGRAPERYDNWMIRWSVVNGLECLIRADQSNRTDAKKEKEAARDIARDYPALDRLLGREASKPEQEATDEEEALERKLDPLAGPIRSWLKSLVGDRVKEKAVQTAFNDSRKDFEKKLEKLSPEVLKAMAATLLSEAEKRAKALVIPSDLDEWSDAAERKLH